MTLNRRIRALEGNAEPDDGRVFHGNLTAWTDDRLRLMSKASTPGGTLDFAFFDTLTDWERGEVWAALQDVEDQRLAWMAAGRRCRTMPL